MTKFLRRLASSGLIAGVALICGAAPASAETAPAPIGFIVKRDGDPIGTHRLTFHTEMGPDGERLIVDINIDIVVRIASVTIYRYTLNGRETWQDGKLLALDTATDDDGTKKAVRVRATDGGLQVDAAHAHYVAPPDTLPETYWRLDTVTHRHFIDIEDGQLVDLISTPAGQRTITVADKPVVMDVYHVEGDITGELGYGTDGQWMFLHFPTHGSDILYTREPQ